MSQGGSFGNSGGTSGDVTEVTGTANQVTASPSTGDVVLSTPSVFIAPGSIASTTTTSIGTDLLLTTTTSSTQGAIKVNGEVYWNSGNGLFLGPNSPIGNNGISNYTLGGNCLQALTFGGNNLALGSNPGEFLTTGSNNILIGTNAGLEYLSSESDNICIGHSNGSGVTGESGAMRLGDSNYITKCFIAGISGVTVTGTAVLCSTSGQLGTISSSARYKENIKPMHDSVSVMNLKPVEFNYKADPSKSKQYGLIAEDIEKDFPYLCFYDKEGRPESVKYHELPVLLLKEIQRLNKRIEQLEMKSCH